MWTRNWFNFLTALFYGDTTSTSGSTPSDYNPPIRARLVSGGYIAIGTEHYSQSFANTQCENGNGYWATLALGKAGVSYQANPTSTTTELCIGFGSGSTPATYDDYRLETPISAGLTLVARAGILKNASAYNSDNNKYGALRNFTINNSSGSSITIREIGLFGPMGWDGSGNNMYPAMIYREVLDEPITLDPSESVIVSITREGTPLNYIPY